MGVQIPHEKGKVLGERVAHCKVYGLSAVSCAETAKPIGLPFGLWTRVGQRKHEFIIVFARGPNMQNFNRIRQVVPM